MQQTRIALLIIWVALLSLSLDRKSRAVESNWEWNPATVHPDRIVGVDWSPDGSKLATTSTNGSHVCIWDARTGHKLQTVYGRSMAMNYSPVFSWDGKRILGHASNVSRTVVWDAVTGQHVRTLVNFAHAVRAGSLNEDGTVALLAGGSGNALLWDVNTGETTKIIAVSRAGTLCAAMSSDAKRGIVGMADGTAAILDLAEGKVAHTLKGHTGEVRCVSISKDGKTAITGSEDRNVIVWNAQTGEKIHTLTDEAVNHTTRVQASADGKIIIANSSLHLFIWDGTTGKLIRRQNFKGFISPASLNPDGTKIALRTEADGLCIIDVKSGERDAVIFGTVGPVLSLSWHPKDQALAVGSTTPAPVIWSIGKNAGVQAIGNAGPCTCIGWDREGKQLFVSAEGNVVALHDVANPEKVRTFKAEFFSPSGASLATDGKLAISDSQKTMAIWDTVKNEKLKALDTGSYLLNGVRWSPDASRLLVLNRDDIIIWETEKWERIHALRGQFSTPVMAEWSHDGSRIAACYSSFDEAFLYVWDAKTGKRTRTIEANTAPMSAVCWSPDSANIASGSRDGLIILWDADTRKQLHVLKGHSGMIAQMGWSQNGKWLASGSLDGSTRIWDVKTGKEICLLINFFNGKEWLVLTPDGQYDGSEKGLKQQLYRKAGTSELIAPEKYLLKQTPGLLTRLLAP
jgi:WD40 repeat protein